MRALTITLAALLCTGCVSAHKGTLPDGTAVEYLCQWHLFSPATTLVVMSGKEPWCFSGGSLTGQVATGGGIAAAGYYAGRHDDGDEITVNQNDGASFDAKGPLFVFPGSP